MKKFKILLTVFSLIFCTTSAVAADLDKLIEKSDIAKTATVAVSVKDVKNGKTVFEYNSHKLLNPASVLKIFTMKAAYSQLGENYLFETATYLDKNNNLYIKMAADPSFSTGMLKSLLTSTKNNINVTIKDIVIDPTVIENEQWGIGWMWDDDTSYLLPKLSPFSINENNIDITLNPQSKGKIPEIVNNSKYQMQFVNKLNNGDKNTINLDRQPWKTSDATTISGSIKSQIKLKLPVDRPEIYFIGVLEETLKAVDLKYDGKIKIAPTQKDAKKVSAVSSQALSYLVANTLKNSNNFYAEMILKKAGGAYTKKTGTTKDGVSLFYKYFADIKSDKLIIVDACGISRNNLVTADWITTALNKIYKEKDFNHFSTLMAKPMEGTLSDRLLDISLKLRAKTGTASNISSLAGYIDTKNNKKYSFAIMIQNHKEQAIEAKKFEDLILKEIYKLN